MMVLWVLAVWGTVARPVENLHAQPSAEAEVVSQAVYGANVELVERSGDWARVRTADRYTGWMAASGFLRRETPYAAGRGVAQVSSLFANLYREPSATAHAPVLTLAYDTRLEAAPEAGTERWMAVRLVDGATAWIDRGDVEIEPRPLSVEETIRLAKRLLGFPYLWGGVSTFGYDCSGLTQMLARRRGVLLPRDARLQAAWEGATTVEREALQPGDLLFFGHSPRKIAHTGMYLGGGEMIHATPPYIQIGRVEAEAQKRGWAGARRLK